MNDSDEKTVKIDKDYQIEDSSLGNWFLEDTETSKFWLSMRVKIEKTIYCGKECYVIENDKFAKDPNQHIIYYIEKDTGLRVRQIQHDRNMDYSYEFGNIEDEIFEEPNRAEYRLIE